MLDQDSGPLLKKMYIMCLAHTPTHNKWDLPYIMRELSLYTRT